MSSLPFARLVVIETTEPARLRGVGSVLEAAERLAAAWPEEGRGRSYVNALQACHDALAGTLETETARKAFVLAAKEVDVFVRESQRPGDRH